MRESASVVNVSLLWFRFGLFNLKAETFSSMKRHLSNYKAAWKILDNRKWFWTHQVLLKWTSFLEGWSLKICTTTRRRLRRLRHIRNCYEHQMFWLIWLCEELTLLWKWRMENSDLCSQILFKWINNKMNPFQDSTHLFSRLILLIFEYNLRWLRL